MNSWVVFFLIIIVKAIEISLTTLRINLVTKNEKTKGAIVGFVEIIIWVLVVSTVLQDITSDPKKVLAYAIGFALGNYLGVTIEGWIGIGTTRIEIIVEASKSKDIVDYIRSKGYALTQLDGKGMNSDRHVLIIVIRRRCFREFMDILKNIEGLFVSITDVRPIYGGYGSLRK